MHLRGRERERLSTAYALRKAKVVFQHKHHHHHHLLAKSAQLNISTFLLIYPLVEDKTFKESLEAIFSSTAGLVLLLKKKKKIKTGTPSHTHASSLLAILACLTNSEKKRFPVHNDLQHFHTLGPSRGQSTLT